jgi:putative alpha-1,2-mannosidase
MGHIHPAIDDGPEYLVDPVSAANIISQLLQIVLAFVGPEKAKAALDWEIVQAANAAAVAANASTDAWADAEERRKFSSGP